MVYTGSTNAKNNQSLLNFQVLPDATIIPLLVNRNGTDLSSTSFPENLPETKARIVVSGLLLGNGLKPSKSNFTLLSQELQ